MADRPAFFFFLDRSLSNIIADYDENPLNTTGVQPGQLIPSELQNTGALVGGLWQSYLDYGTLRLPDYVDTTTDQQWSTTKLTYPNGVSVVAGPGPTPIDSATYFFEGYRIHIDECILKAAGAAPLKQPLATRPGRLWIYLSTANISDPGQPFAAARVESAGVGAAAAPAAQELALVGVDIDAAGVVFGNTYPAVEPAEEVVFGLRVQRWTGLTRFEDTLTAVKVGGTAIDVEGLVDIDGGVLKGLNVANDRALTETATFTNVSGPAIVSVGDHATSAASTAENIGAGPSIKAVKTVAGTALVADATAGAGTAISALGGAVGVAADSSAGEGVSATTATGRAILGTASTSGKAVEGVGGNSAASLGGLYSSTHVGATSLRAQTAPSATATAVAVQGTGFADSIGVKGQSSDGYGLVAQSDTTSPKRSAFRLEPQDDDPTTTQQGDVHFGSDRGPTGKIRVRTTQFESAHSSSKGHVFEVGATASGGPIGGGSGNLSLLQVQPEEVGDILLTCTGDVEFSNNLGTATLQILDVTGAPIVIATRPLAAPDRGASGTEVADANLRGRYTVPGTTLRSYAIVITYNAGGGTLDYDNVILSCVGTL